MALAMRLRGSPACPSCATRRARSHATRLAAPPPRAPSLGQGRRERRVRAAGPGTAGGPDERLPEDGGIEGFDPMEELGVPRDQRPVNELAALRETFLYDWAVEAWPGLLLRCGGAFGLVFALMAAPIANATFDPAAQPAQFVLSASAGSLVAVSALLLRTYLGWAYVGNRLLSAVIEYEETGWYDGQLFVKPPKVLARDRLLGAYEVKPALAKLKGLLGAAGVSLAAVSVALYLLISASRDADGFYGRGAGAPLTTSAGVTYRVMDSAAAEEEEAMQELAYNDAAAAAEAAAIQAALGSVPAWCDDRYLQAMAGARSVDCDALRDRARAERAEGAR